MELLTVGQTFKGLYKIVDELGVGDYTAVYLARNVETKRVVALKIVRPELLTDGKFLQRFEREAMILSEMDNPHVVKIYDYGVDEGRNYIAMEFVTGKSLSALMREYGLLDVDQALDITRQVAEGLQHAYEHGVVHRDINPRSIMVSAEGVVKLMDFGIAKSLSSTGLTSTDILGTPNYIAPEQADGRPVDIRADLYSLGAVLYEMLTGKVLYQGDNPAMVIMQHMTAPIPKVTQVRPDVSPAVEAILNRCLAKKPAERFGTPADLVAAIAAITGKPAPQPVAPAPVAPARPEPPSAKVAPRAAPRPAPAAPPPPVTPVPPPEPGLPPTVMAEMPAGPAPAAPAIRPPVRPPVEPVTPAAARLEPTVMAPLASGAASVLSQDQVRYLVQREVSGDRESLRTLATEVKRLSGEVKRLSTTAGPGLAAGGVSSRTFIIAVAVLVFLNVLSCLVPLMVALTRGR
ncbi:MAG: serine/threonine protein kinase [Chloroflexi bacterium]|nr:serine/threonine protein kinase [Chloroflexota bacterium]